MIGASPITTILRGGCIEQAMDRPEGFPRAILNICEEDDIDILVGVVTDHRTYACVVAFLSISPRESPPPQWGI